MRVAERPKMAFIERQDVARAVPVGEYHKGRIGDPEVESCVAIEDLERLRNVVGAKGLELVHAACNLDQNASRCSRGNTGRQEVVELCEYERRQ